MQLTEETPTGVIISVAAQRCAALAAAPTDPAQVAAMAALAEPLGWAVARLMAGNDKRRMAAVAGKGRPAVGYLVDDAENGTTVVWGAAAAAAAVGTTKGNVSVRMSGGNKYGRTLERDGRPVVVSVRRATPDEEAAQRHNEALMINEPDTKAPEQPPRPGDLTDPRNRRKR